MEGKSEILPENNTIKHLHRVYYANVCNYCFSSENLLKCAACKCVSYCSKEHQVKDWSFHQPTCTAMKQINSRFQKPKNCDKKTFYEYRAAIFLELIRNRVILYSVKVSRYEEQICCLPWVCPVCFKKPSNQFECKCCKTIAYCSLDHLESDKKEHNKICLVWKLCKIYNSMYYENGYKISAKQPEYQSIKRSVKNWPCNKAELMRLVQNEYVEMNCDIEILLNVFIDPYIPGAIIINALEKARLVKKRRLILKEFEERRKFHQKPGTDKMANRKAANLQKRTTLTIHFPEADVYEIKFDWVKIARLLTDWIINVKKIEIVLAGSQLQRYPIPSFGNLGENIHVSAFTKSYQEIQHKLPKPDCIVMFEFIEMPSVFNNYEYQILGPYTEIKEILFNHIDVPVILCDGHDAILSKVMEFILELGDIQPLVSVTHNSFLDIDCTRCWNISPTVFTRNSSLCVLTRK